MVYTASDHAPSFAPHHEPVHITGHDDVTESGGLDSTGHHYAHTA